MAQRRKQPSIGLGRIIAGAVLATVLFIVVIVGFLVGTKVGRKLVYQFAAEYIYQSVGAEKPKQPQQSDKVVEDGKVGQVEINDSHLDPWYDKDEQVRNFLIYGVEEIDGAKNTDTMMIGSINMETGAIKLTSLMRDTLVNIDGYRANKLNTAFALGGVELLMDTIERNYMIDLDGYAWVNFDSFEEIINMLGGLDMELTSAEANYLNTTNYISNPAYRNVSSGMNHLNGNQVLGYCRVRYVGTSTSTYNDYGRTERHRYVLSTIFKTYIKRNILELMTLTTDCLEYVNTNVSQEQIAAMLECVVENRMASMETFRLPIDGYFDDPEEYNGVTYPLVLDWEANIQQYYQFLFGDTEEEAIERYEKYKAKME